MNERDKELERMMQKSFAKAGHYKDQAKRLNSLALEKAAMIWREHALKCKDIWEQEGSKFDL